ncbi:MAG: sulfurtransferase TusA family protein [Deferrisomatales bacterium]|nr:sulfurtransferase TusA family protein [Deferrisomatales bacterium]
MSSSCETRHLDIRGQICPSTLLTALREVNLHKDALKDGSLRLVIVTDDRNATATIPNAVDNMGYRVTVERDDQSYRITVGGPDV